MSRPRRPVDVVIAGGGKHLTKAEIAERRAQELSPITDDITAPSYLTAKQKRQFYEIAGQLEKLGIMGETDVDALARYIISLDLYLKAVKALRSKKVNDDPKLLYNWGVAQDRYFKQCRTSASDLGLTITSRCRLVVPKKEGADEEKANRFSRFRKDEERPA